MIDFATPVRKSRILDPLVKDKSTIVDSVFSGHYGDAMLDYSDVARRIVSSRPAACIALAFAVGGIVAWLTSRR